jgi:tryptophan-rich sensory protein
MKVHAAMGWPKLAASLLASFAAAAVGSLFTFPSIGGWYASLVKPAFTPPNWAFGPVWTTLYVLMALSLWLVWNRTLKKPKTKPFAAFGIQLALNALWSVAFFGLRSPALGLAVIAALWLSIAACILMFWKIDRRASCLLLPYIAWVTIAAYLNLGVFLLNP